MADTSITRRRHNPADDRALERPTFTLEGWSRLEWLDGLQIDELAPLGTIEVHTRNSVYEITVIDGSAGDVLVQGGSYFRTATRVRLNGCTAGGSCLKRRGVYAGFRLEFQLGREVVVTTRVQSIARVERTSTSQVH